MVYLTSENKQDQPLVTETGEIIYEMIGDAVTPSLGANHSLARIILPPGKSSSLHYHKVTQETYFVLKGEGTLRVNDQQTTMLPGQACWIGPGEAHQIENEGDVDLVFLAFCSPPWVPEDSFEVED